MSTLLVCITTTVQYNRYTSTVDVMRRLKDELDSPGGLWSFEISRRASWSHWERSGTSPWSQSLGTSADNMLTHKQTITQVCTRLFTKLKNCNYVCAYEHMCVKSEQKKTAERNPFRCSKHIFLSALIPKKNKNHIKNTSHFFIFGTNMPKALSKKQKKFED